VACLQVVRGREVRCSHAPGSIPLYLRASHQKQSNCSYCLTPSRATVAGDHSKSIAPSIFTEVPNMNLLGRTSVKIEGAMDFEWSPATVAREGVKQWLRVRTISFEGTLIIPTRAGLLPISGVQKQSNCSLQGQSLSIYELPNMNLLGRTSVKIEGAMDFEWSPISGVQKQSNCSYCLTPSRATVAGDHSKSIAPSISV
jgi:hypothetical protein